MISHLARMSTETRGERIAVLLLHSDRDSTRLHNAFLPAASSNGAVGRGAGPRTVWRVFYAGRRPFVVREYTYEKIDRS